MPIYEYECSQCGHGDSFLEERGAARRRKCPRCGRRTFARVMSAAAFQLKGGGWYATDFRDSGKPKPKPDGEKDGGKNGETGGEKGGKEKADAAAKQAGKNGGSKTGGKDGTGGGEKKTGKTE